MPRGSVVLISPASGDHGRDHMAWQEEMGFPFRLVTGGLFHPTEENRLLSLLEQVDKEGRAPELSDEERSVARGSLRRFGVEYVVVLPGAYEDQRRMVVAEVLGDAWQPGIWAVPS